MGKEIRNNLLLVLVGYFKHLFLSQAIFIGLFFVFLPIIYLSDKFSGLSHSLAKILEVYGNIFSMHNPSDFFNITIGIICTVFPLMSYLLSKIFKLRPSNKIITVKAKILFVFYFILVLINTLVIYLFDKNFNILVFFALIFILLVSIVAYSMSSVCDYVRSKIVA